MGIQSSEVSFNLVFKLNYYNDHKLLTPTQYFESNQELYEQTQNIELEIKENVPFEIIFSSEDDQAKLFMDGLDSLPEKFVKIEKDGGEPYLSPSSSAITLYQNKDEFYPYIPGLYTIKIQTKSKTYYTWLKIITNRINEEQLETMRNEVETVLRGLAQDLIRKSFGYSYELNSKISATILHQFMVINHHFPSIMAAVNDLYRKINFYIRKDYMIVPQERSSIIDFVSIRHRVMHPETKNIVKTPVRKVNYDLPENRLLKRIIQFLIKNLSDFILSVELYIDNINQEVREIENSFYRKESVVNQKLKIIEQLHLYLEKAKKMRGMLNWIKTAPWYKEISETIDTSIPHVMITDVRYRTLFQVQRELQKEMIIKYDKLFSYQWKRTDKLYEIWGFLQFIKAIQHEKLGFKLVNGWIFDNDNINIDKIIISTIPPDTTLTFEKENLIIKLVYEGKLPPRSKETDFETQPLYTIGTNNCPDGRLDLYRDDIYIGSLLFDFKYRNKNVIWSPIKITNNQRTDAMRQLISYASDCRSDHLFGDRLNEYLRNSIRPVPEVWALYPERTENQRVTYYKDHNVKLIELSPGFKNEHLIEEIDQIIKKLVDRSPY